MINEQINDQIVAINILTNNFLKLKNYYNADTNLDNEVKKILTETINFEIKLMNKQLKKEYIKIQKEIAAKKNKIKNLDASLGGGVPTFVQPGIKLVNDACEQCSWQKLGNI